MDNCFNNTFNRDIKFRMEDPELNPHSGLTVSGVRSIDHGEFLPMTGTIEDLGDGVYLAKPSEEDYDGTVIIFLFIAPKMIPCEFEKYRMPEPGTTLL